ncbi:NlpC/P60 family protein [Streptomyces sp. NPDC023723]|uniref:C40 family peptidase n=1 Tax=Streptomyces sp. NPDC023723 TaxID=3154323 RepID=UPI0033CB4877
MAAHRRLRQRTVHRTSARTAATIALAGAATATGWDGTGHAAPEPTPAQVEATVDRLYREAEAATEQYNGTRERADAAERRLERLRDETARKEERLGEARTALGSVAAAQYRDGGLDPALRLALSAEPDRYLDSAARIERAGDRHATAVAGVRKQLREIERLRGAARVEVASLASRQAELKRHRATITGKLAQARRLLSRLTEPQPAHAARSAGDRDALSAGAAEAPNPRAAAAVAYAYAKLGSPYVWGATGPNAFDCSGLIQAAYRSAGVALPRTTYAQIDTGHRVSRAELRPGDLVFFYPGVTHVGLYVGNGRMIHAPNPSSPVRVAPVDEMPFAGATRVA